MTWIDLVVRLVLGVVDLKELMRAQFRRWTMFLALGAVILAGALGNERGTLAQDTASAWEAVTPDATLCQADPAGQVR